LTRAAAARREVFSIEAAQPNLDLATLDGLGDKTVIFGVISMGDPEPETPETVATRIRAALKHLPPEPLIPAPRLRHEIHLARHRLRQIAGAHRGGRDRKARADELTGGQHLCPHDSGVGPHRNLFDIRTDMCDIES